MFKRQLFIPHRSHRQGIAAPAVLIASMFAFGHASHAAQPAYCSTLDKPFITSTPSVTAEGKGVGPSLIWPSKKTHFRLHSAGTTDLNFQTSSFVTRTSFHTWTQVPGADFKFEDLGTTESRRIGFDFRHPNENENIVIFQSEWLHDGQIIGLTTATFNSQTGEIIDSDIELNDQYYTFTDTDVGGQTDLQNTLTHEIGHFIGFDHTDREGSTIPVDCSTKATMSRSAGPAEISKRVLAGSDEAGMVFVYPLGSAARQVSPPASVPKKAFVITEVSASLGGGCQSASVGSLLAPLAFVLRRRRYSTSCDSARRDSTSRD